MGAARDVSGPGGVRGSLAGAADGLAEPKWWPPGFRFHPTDEELVLYYLKRKVCGRRLKPSTIGDVDVYKWEPWELPDKSALKTGDKQWYFFSPRDRKYPNGSRSNRATRNGYWKTTGKDRTIYQNSKTMGNKKTLVYYHGRAPRGERTDWVMHEYTMDEQVLLSYNNVQDCYALYKVFRKSGPGPKNGEQYGAPFREEEWDNDEVDESFRCQDNMEFPFNQRNTEVPVTEPQLTSTGAICDAGYSLPMNELEDLLLKLSDEQDIIGQCSQQSAYISEVDVGTQVVDHNLYPSLTEATSFEDNDTWGELNALEESSQIARNDSSDTQPVETPELTSLTCDSQQPLQQTDEEFLEIKDFNDPESILWKENDLSNRDQIDGPEGFYDSYDYFDTHPAFSNDYGLLGLTTQNSYLDGYGDEGMMLDQSYDISTDLWNHDQGFSVTNANQNQAVMAATTSGVAYASTSSKIQQIQGQGTGVGGTSGSWISSAFSTLLDSVPSRPALASENAFICRALERVSSFRGQTGVNVQNTTTGSQSPRRGGRNGSVLFISFLVGLSAVFWFLTIGATIKIVKGFWSRFSSS